MHLALPGMDDLEESAQHRGQYAGSCLPTPAPFPTTFSAILVANLHFDLYLSTFSVFSYPNGDAALVWTGKSFSFPQIAGSFDDASYGQI